MARKPYFYRICHGRRYHPSQRKEPPRACGKADISHLIPELQKEMEAFDAKLRQGAREGSVDSTGAAQLSSCSDASGASADAPPEDEEIAYRRLVRPELRT